MRSNEFILAFPPFLLVNISGLEFKRGECTSNIKSEFIFKDDSMLIKNKIYLSIIIGIFIACLIIGLNENIIVSSLGERVFYILSFLFNVLILIGVIGGRDTHT